MNTHIAPEILLYHRVTDCVPDNQYLSVTPEHFEAHLDILSSHRRVLPLYDLVHLGTKGHLVTKGVAITFDDGYADNLLNALPLLEKYRCPATVFVTAKLLGHPHGFWYDVLEDVLLRPAVLPPLIRLDHFDQEFPLRSAEERLFCHEALFNCCKAASPRTVRLLLNELLETLGMDSIHYTSPHPLLTTEQLAALAASPWIEIGSHTLTHPVLSRLSDAEQRHEILQARTLLESLIHKPVRLFAYPYGNVEAFNKTTCMLTAEAGLYGIANIQDSLSLPLDPVRVPRRLVRNWPGRTFRRWLDAADRNLLEHQTTGPRLQMIHAHLQNHFPRHPAPLLRRPEHTAPTPNPLRIVHVNTLIGEGGASRVTEQLAATQNAMGHEACILTSRTLVEDPIIECFEPAPSSKLTSVAQAEGLLDYHLQGSHSLHRRESFHRAQIVHFHNLHGGYFNPWSLAGLSRLRPAVWTLHDMHALTGHCAHALTCTRWHEGCGLCPDLQGYPAVSADNTHRLWRDKRRIYACSPVHVVTPSQWLADHVRKSSLREHPVAVIPNGIDTQIFTPGDKKVARARLGIPDNTLVIGNAAHGGPLHNPWKGGAFAIETLKAVLDKFSNILFLGCGNTEAAANGLVRLLPYAHSEEEMADFYTALDLMLYPSLADNCPLVVLEAMACGLPVVTFAVGGIPELVDDGETGIVVPAQDGDALTRATLEVIENQDVLAQMSRAARAKAEREYDVRLMAQRYERLYGDVRAAWTSRRASSARLAPQELSSLVNTAHFRELAQVAELASRETERDRTKEQWSTTPLSRVFGFDRGLPVDRVFIEKFLRQHRDCIRGRVLEVAENTYTHRFGTGVTKSDILYATSAPEATLTGDLAQSDTLPQAAFDCIILTQTLQFIYDLKKALSHVLAALRPEGSLLLTTSGISQISRYDMDRWGEYWRFTDKAMRDLFKELAPSCVTQVVTYGNAGLAKAFLDGRAAEELPPELFEAQDPDYQLVVCAHVRRPFIME